MVPATKNYSIYTGCKQINKVKIFKFLLCHWNDWVEVISGETRHWTSHTRSSGLQSPWSLWSSPVTLQSLTAHVFPHPWKLDLKAFTVGFAFNLCLRWNIAMWRSFSVFNLKENDGQWAYWSRSLSSEGWPSSPNRFLG